MTRFLLSKKGFSLIVGFLFISTIIISCSGNQHSNRINKEILTTTPTSIPTTAPDRVLLAAPKNIPENELSEAQALVSQLAAGSGLEFEVREEIITSEITSDVKIVVFLDQPNNLGSLAANAPGTQFVAISNQNWSPPPNVTIIQESQDHAAFLAGYLSAMVAPSFRVGALQISENVQFNQAFYNGVKYYCGLCAAVIYPLNTYPVISQLSAKSSPADWQGAFNEINASKVNVLFLSPEILSAELGKFLSGLDVAIISTQTPPDEFRSRWVATISSDGLPALNEIWNDLLIGQGGKIINAGLKVSDVNYMQLTDGLVWLSQGKMELLNKVIGLLREDQIYPYSIIQ
ncbi:MAG: hypothetical protein J7L66_02380 [Anaerolineaceae bacterium]|nr:hypothetical protein [Anaerolineaceae bacterium]